MPNDEINLPGDEEEAVTPRNWAALSGLWAFGDERTTYRGPLPEARVPYGLAINDVRLRDGRVSVSITFDQLKDASAGIVLGFHAETMSYVIPQLGGYATAYAIAVFDPSVGWHAVEGAGSIRNLVAGQPYALEVEQVGQRIRMAVNSVRIFDHTLASPLPGNQVGLFGFGGAPIAFTGFVASPVQPRLFVAMQFGEPYDTLYEEVIRAEGTQLGFNVVRIDEVYRPGIVFEDMKREISEAKVVVAEITAPNQNVR